MRTVFFLCVLSGLSIAVLYSAMRYLGTGRPFREAGQVTIKGGSKVLVTVLKLESLLIGMCTQVWYGCDDIVPGSLQSMRG